jgi:hypothetical protein
MHVNDLSPDLLRHIAASATFDLHHEAARREFTSALESTNDAMRKTLVSSAPRTA